MSDIEVDAIQIDAITEKQIAEKQKQPKKIVENEQEEGDEGNQSDNETLQLALKLSKALAPPSKHDANSSKFANIEASFSLENLIKEVEDTLSKGHYTEKHIFDKVQMLMEHYDASTKDYQQYAIKLDENQYTRNLIRNSEYFTLMLLCWPPNIASPIHDHGGSECWLRVVKGHLEEAFYEIPQRKSAIKLRFKQVHKAGGVCFINDDQGLHSVSNPLNNEWAISLHCYVPGYVECNAYFDKKNSDKKKSCKLSFTSIDGKKLVNF